MSLEEKKLARIVNLFLDIEEKAKRQGYEGIINWAHVHLKRMEEAVQPEEEDSK